MSVWRKRSVALILVGVVLLLKTSLIACNSTAIPPDSTSPISQSVPSELTMEPEKSATSEELQEMNGMKLKVEIRDCIFSITLENNVTADALVSLIKAAPLEIKMRDYSGFEKVGSLGTSLPAEDRRTTTQVGDIVLYNSNQIVMFYGSNCWSYTRLGRIDDLTGWEEALGSGDVTVRLFLS